MNHKGIIASLLVVILIIAGMFMYAKLKEKEIQSQSNAGSELKSATSTPYDYIERIDAKHFVEGSNHTLLGEVVLPTPCDLLDVDASVNESSKSVHINFKVVNTTTSCAQVMTAQKFQTSFVLEGEPHITASINERPIILNLIPGASGETPRDSQLYIKG